MIKPKIRLRNKPLFATVEPDYTLWTVYIPNADGEMAFMKMYDVLATSRGYIESVISVLYKEWRRA